MEVNQNILNNALLVMDVQGATIKRLKDPQIYLDTIAKVIQKARDNHVAVFYIVVGFRKGYPEVSPRNKSFVTLKSSPMNLDSEEALKIPDSIEPQPGDVIITKKRVSAFTGSDLEVVLRSFGITHLTLCGIATSGVVLSTLREAADKDYSMTVLADCCADMDDEVHRVLTVKIFPRQADVIHSENWFPA